MFFYSCFFFSLFRFPLKSTHDLDCCVKSLRAAFFESSNVDKVPTKKLMPKLTTSSSAVDLPMRLNQNNNANSQMIDSLNYKSNEHYFSNSSSNHNKPNSIVDNHRNSFYPKMNFTSSIVTSASTLPVNVPIMLDTDANKINKHLDSLTGQNDQCSMQNMVKQNFCLTNSFSTGAMTNLNSSNNCNFNSIQIGGHEPLQRPQFQHQPPLQQQRQQQHQPPLQQQPPPPPSSTSTALAYSSNSNTTQMQTLNVQSSQQMPSQQQQPQNLGTKVTRHKRSNQMCFYLSCSHLLYSTNRVHSTC